MSAYKYIYIILENEKLHIFTDTGNGDTTTQFILIYEQNI